MKVYVFIIQHNFNMSNPITFIPLTHFPYLSIFLKQILDIILFHPYDPKLCVSNY